MSSGVIGPFLSLCLILKLNQNMSSRVLGPYLILTLCLILKLNLVTQEGDNQEASGHCNRAVQVNEQ